MFPQQISVCFGCLEKSSYRNLCGLQGWTVGDQLQHLAVDREVFNCIWQFAVPFYFLEFFFCDVHQVFSYNPLQVKLFHTDGAWKDPRPKFLYFPCHRRKQSEFFYQFPPGIMYILWSRFSPCIFSYSNAAAPFQTNPKVQLRFEQFPNTPSQVWSPNWNKMPYVCWTGTGAVGKYYSNTAVQTAFSLFSPTITVHWVLARKDNLWNFILLMFQDNPVHFPNHESDDAPYWDSSWVLFAHFKFSDRQTLTEGLKPLEVNWTPFQHSHLLFLNPLARIIARRLQQLERLLNQNHYLLDFKFNLVFFKQ